jgi:hypothetical protein
MAAAICQEEAGRYRRGGEDGHGSRQQRVPLAELPHRRETLNRCLRASEPGR